MMVVGYGMRHATGAPRTSSQLSFEGSLLLNNVNELVPITDCSGSK